MITLGKLLLFGWGCVILLLIYWIIIYNKNK